MSGADRRHWDTRHAVAGEPAPVPPQLLAGREALLPPSGRALDVACGRGATAVWLAEQGLGVDAVDVSPVAINAGAELAQRRGVRVRWWIHDLDAGLPEHCDGPYDVVVCQRFRDPALYPVLGGILVPGGLLAVTVHSEVGRPRGSFRAAPGELRDAFAGWDVIVTAEGSGEACLLARRPLM